VRDILDAFYRGPVPLVDGGKNPGGLVCVANLVDGTLLAAESEKAAGRIWKVFPSRSPGA
jgi:hypothetical protein